jgi:hypothetical protein
MKVDINVQNRSGNNLDANNNLEQNDIIPTLNLYQNVKSKGVFSTNKQDSNTLENYASPKNKDLQTQNNIINNDHCNQINKINTLNNTLYKQIHLFEFRPKKNSNTLEYFLNNLLKYNKFNFLSLPNGQINSSLFPPSGNNNINKNSNNIPNGMNNNGNPNKIQEAEELPFNVSEYNMPLIDEENISKLLRLNDYFQDQTEDMINLIVNEIIYVTVPKDGKIYDLNDLSNYYYIINKGRVNLIKNRDNK